MTPEPRPPASRRPEGAPPDHIRTFKRRGRMTGAKRDTLDTLGSQYLWAVDELAAWGRPGAPKVLEVGFGDGDTTLAFAVAHPGADVLAVEVHRPGIATLLARLDAGGVTNVAVHDGDAVDALAVLAPGSLAEVHVFFPDPWPKIRHHARRIVRPDVVRRWAELLGPGGALHLATDMADYAVRMRAVVAADGAFDAPAEDRAGRLVTKYERHGLAAGRAITDLRFVRH
jgi:tRNA (guanine-N7-)-methyltransferase